VGLVVDHALPRVGLHQIGLPQCGFVSNDIDIGCDETLGRVLLVPRHGGCRDVDVHCRALQDCLPLLENGNGGDQERVLADLLEAVLDEAGHLNRLAEPHVVAQEAARPLLFSREHPVDADDLVVLVVKTGPESNNIA